MLIKKIRKLSLSIKDAVERIKEYLQYNDNDDDDNIRRFI